ncbi:hypothetical protein BC937DRAFT_91197 [Endogone sp. FLAS-F59071]|nr:hypothetical protein BC937DRAFT_91197 [Endogone sp. FLAS-F59071]|eukprot:RUS16436.1 hypothetical protein BC937DRAFT_91197 [Endogone sp. FLAS-F59071]
MLPNQKNQQSNWDAIAELDFLSNPNQKSPPSQWTGSPPKQPSANKPYSQSASVFNDLAGLMTGGNSAPSSAFSSTQMTYGSPQFSSTQPLPTNAAFGAKPNQSFPVSSSNTYAQPSLASNGTAFTMSAASSSARPNSWSPLQPQSPSSQPPLGWNTTSTFSTPVSPSVFPTHTTQSKNIMDDFGDFAAPAPSIRAAKDEFGDFFSSPPTAAFPTQSQSRASPPAPNGWSAFADLSSQSSSSSFTSPILGAQQPHKDLTRKRASMTAVPTPASMYSSAGANGGGWATSTSFAAVSPPDSRGTPGAFGLTNTGSPTYTSPRIASAVTVVQQASIPRSASVLSIASTSSFGSAGGQERKVSNTLSQPISPALSSMSVTSQSSPSKPVNWDDFAGIFSGASDPEPQPSIFSSPSALPLAQAQPVVPSDIGFTWSTQLQNSQSSANTGMGWSSQPQSQPAIGLSAQQPFMTPLASASDFSTQSVTFTGLVPTQANVASPSQRHVQPVAFAAQGGSFAGFVSTPANIVSPRQDHTQQQGWTPITPPTQPAALSAERAKVVTSDVEVFGGGFIGPGGVPTGGTWAPVTPPVMDGLGQANLLAELDFGRMNGSGAGAVGEIARTVEDDFGGFASTAGGSDEFGDFGGFESSTFTSASTMPPVSTRAAPPPALPLGTIAPSSFIFSPTSPTLIPHLPPTNLVTSPTSPTYSRPLQSPRQGSVVVLPGRAASMSASQQKPVDQQEALRRAFETSAVYMAAKEARGGGNLDAFATLADGKPTSLALAAPAAPVPSSTGNSGKNTVDDMRKVLGRLITAEYLEEALACTKHIEALESNTSSSPNLQPPHIQAVWRQLPTASRPADRPTMRAMVDGIRAIGADKAESFITKFNTNLMFLAQSHLDEAIEVQREAVAWFSMLTSGDFHTRAREWTRCLEAALDEFGMARDFLRALVAELARGVDRERDRHAVLATDRVKTYVAGVTEMWRIVRRIAWAVQRNAEFLSGGEKQALDGLTRKCEEAWKGVVEGLDGVKAKVSFAGQSIAEELHPFSSYAVVIY